MWITVGMVYNMLSLCVSHVHDPKYQNGKATKYNLSVM